MANYRGIGQVPVPVPVPVPDDSLVNKSTVGPTVDDVNRSNTRTLIIAGVVLWLLSKRR